MNNKTISCHLIVFWIVLLSAIKMEGKAFDTYVVDSTTLTPLPGASIFDKQGNAIGISDNNGKLPYISAYSLPITIRYLGFKETSFATLDNDTLYLTEIPTELPEVIVESKRHKVLHILAYIREYSTLTTYTDSVFLFREKMVDFMLTPDKTTKFKGWENPRILKSKSYYRFTNSQGLDSVSDKCNHHFSWSDWIGIVKSPQMIEAIRTTEQGSDTIYGKYSPTEIWHRNRDKIKIDVNVLADTTSRKWVPNISNFFKNHLDFETFRLQYNYNNVVGDSIYTTDLAGYSFNIESNGRGHDMFRFNHKDQPFFVSTYAEVYILDKEYITTEEAKKWDNKNLDFDNLSIIEPADLPELQSSVKELVQRVNDINHNNIRLDFTPNYRLMGYRAHKQSIGQRALFILKQLTGISSYKSRRNFNRNWNTFQQNQMKKNNNKTE